MKLKPVHIDGALWIIIGVCGSLQAPLSSDLAKTFFTGKHLFETQCILGALLAGAGSLKAFRSTSYAQHLKLQSDIASGTITSVKTDIHSEAQAPAAPSVAVNEPPKP